MGERICIVGNSGSGKSRLARRVAARLDLPHLELDALNHRAGWQEAPVSEFRAAVAATLATFESERGGWVVDGNYRARVGDLLDADTYVWLDYPRRLVMSRVLRRTLGRLLTRRALWNGNRERWRAVTSRDPSTNIVLWSWTQHDAYRRDYQRQSAQDTGARWVRLRAPAETEQWLRQLPA